MYMYSTYHTYIDMYNILYLYIYGRVKGHESKLTFDPNRESKLTFDLGP